MRPLPGDKPEEVPFRAVQGNALFELVVWAACAALEVPPIAVIMAVGLRGLPRAAKLGGTTEKFPSQCWDGIFLMALSTVSRLLFLEVT